MRYRQSFTNFFLAMVIGTPLMGGWTQAHADDLDRTEPMALRKIMQGMGENMQAITDGIAHEDWEIVEKIATLLAEHPQPPVLEKMRILKFIGTDVSKFREYDEKTQQAAMALEQAASRGDGQAVISTFATLQNNCLACHQSFRKPFVEHFYAQH